MNIFKKWYMFWICGIDVKFNKNLLSVPTPDLKNIFIQPERTSEKDRKVCDVPNTPTKGSEPSRND